MSSHDQPLAYGLEWDTNHIIDDMPDADLVKFPGWENVAGWMSTRDIAIPPRIFFEANFQLLKTIDYPFNNVNWPIMSLKMFDALCAAGEMLPHREIRVTMLDDTIPTLQRLDEHGEPKQGVANDRFVCIQLCEYTDALDWDRSEYERHPRLSGRSSWISKLVLKESPGGLPPLFRISANPMHLLVSATARQKLEASGVKGCQFLPLDSIH